MVPAPVAALEEVLDKMDEDISLEPDETPKIDMSLEDEEDETEAAESDAEAEVDVEADEDDEADDTKV